MAKLEEKDLLCGSQTVFFTPENLHHNNYKFLELDRHLSETLQEGCSVFIKGDNDENVVICTDSCTYDVAETETSNSLLLVEGLQFENDLKDVNEPKIFKVTVHGIFYDYLEVTVGKPHLAKLHLLLNKTLYKGPEHEYEVHNEDLMSFEDLVDQIQTSQEELMETLKSLHIVKIDNKIRLLDFPYHFQVLSYMLKLIDENSWSLDEIDYEETLNSLADLVPREVLISLFELYTEESQIIDGLQLYRYKERETCRFFAEVLLHSAGKFNLNEFLQAWKESVPEGMKAEEEMLYGIALINKKSVPNVIHAFPEDNLPENIITRFKVLFEAKEKWTVPEISPYIK